ncbi:MAG: 3-phosphoshikimate 1-carboxyvinyltransferase, partial [Casimicrobium sp.]
MNFLNLAPAKKVAGRLTLPGSKSISNRALLLAALASGRTQLTGLLDSDDTQIMRGALKVLGVAASELVDGCISVSGCGGVFSGHDGDIFVGNAGTATRSLVATLALTAEPGSEYRVDGVARMRERPIGDLVDALTQMGAAIEYTGNSGFPPLTIRAGNIKVDRPIPIRGDVSSQFLTGLLMALPLVTARGSKPAVIEVVGELTSKPYVEITLAMMRQFGVVVERDSWQRFVVPAGAAARYVSPGNYAVEGDASSASYFLAAG